MAESKINILNRTPHPAVAAATEGWVRGGAVALLCRLIRAYQWQSPLWGPHCRFYPSCSEYMREALQHFGFWKGLHQGAARLLKCHPWHPGGVDWVKIPHGK